MTRRSIFAMSAAAAALLCIAIEPHRPLLVWNASASAPIGLYDVTPIDAPRRGDLVLAYPPRQAQRLAAARSYLPFGVPLVKYVTALHGDRICADGLHVSINGREAAIRLPGDQAGRPLPQWHGCRMLTSGEVFLLNGRVLHSFDGRYFGTVPRQNLVGKLRPLWLP